MNTSQLTDEQLLDELFKIEAVCGYTGNKLKITKMQIWEAKEASHFLFLDRNGKIRNIRRMGKNKTWKTRPNVEIPVKYGMYESFRLKFDGHEWVGGTPYKLYTEPK